MLTATRVTLTRNADGTYRTGEPLAIFACHTRDWGFGDLDTYDADRLDGMVGVTRRMVPEGAKVVLGHGWSDDRGPVLGRLRDLRRFGDVLTGTLDRLRPRVALAMAKGEYPNLSIGVGGSDEILHVALLGASNPYFPFTYTYEADDLATLEADAAKDAGVRVYSKGAPMNKTKGYEGGSQITPQLAELVSASIAAAMEPVNTALQMLSGRVAMVEAKAHIEQDVEKGEEAVKANAEEGEAAEDAKDAKDEERGEAKADEKKAEEEREEAEADEKKVDGKPYSRAVTLPDWNARLRAEKTRTREYAANVVSRIETALKRQELPNATELARAWSREVLALPAEYHEQQLALLEHVGEAHAVPYGKLPSTGGAERAVLQPSVMEETMWQTGQRLYAAHGLTQQDFIRFMRDPSGMDVVSWAAKNIKRK